MMRRFFVLTVVMLLSLVSCVPVEKNPVGTTPATTVSATPAPAITSIVTDSADVSPGTRATCPVTAPSDVPFTPPEPYPLQAAGDYFWYGTESLWTALPQDGAWSALPHDAEGYSQKVLWWHAGYSPTEEPEPKLLVTGRRLDAPAPTLIVSEPTNAMSEEILSAMLVGVTFPTAGCWEITGRYTGAELSFVVWVAS